jgi:hypothetical protein
MEERRCPPVAQVSCLFPIVQHQRNASECSEECADFPLQRQLTRLVRATGSPLAATLTPKNADHV